MSDPRAYVAHLAEDSLGLAGGSLVSDSGASLVPQRLVDRIASVLRGAPPGSEEESPFIEKELFALLPQIRHASLEEDGFFVRKARWPEASPLAVALTHDVDNIKRPLSHVWKTRSRFSRLDLLAAFFGKSLYNNVDLIASAEDGRGLRSSFYFMSSEYSLGSVRASCDRLRHGGWEVGLHGDFGTHDSLERMNQAIEKLYEGLGTRPTGLREHYLRFDFAKSWKIMDEAGFDYDTTVGNTDRLGFRLGMATPFRPPDEDWRPLRLLELPLSLMDTTLWGYLKETEDEGLEDFARMMTSVEEVEGLFTLLWHQEAVRMKGGRIYWKIIDAVKRKRCFTGSGAQISRWWRARSVPLVKKGRLITIGGTPPPGLVLKLVVRDGRVPNVTSGSLRKLGEYEYLAKVDGPTFTLEVV